MSIGFICEAIAKKKCLEVFYDGYSRVVEPHRYGLTAENNEILAAWQIRGGSVSNEPVGWKNLRLNETRGIRILDETFQGPRPDYTRYDKKIPTVYCQL